MKKLIVAVVCLATFSFLCVLPISMYAISKYNSMVAGREEVKSKWSQVEIVCQRRADLIPNFVETVKGYTSHEKDTIVQTIKARAEATKISVDPSKLDAKAISQFQQNQGELTAALGRLMVVVEKYPEVKANTNFRDFQAELAGSDNRIAVERKKYNDSAQKFNTQIQNFPDSWVAKFGGFEQFPYFKAEQGADKAPKVKF